MIATRQRTDALNNVIKSLLSEGISPTIKEIMKRLQQMYKGRSWGEPQAQLRPAIEWQPIGGPEGTDIETTYEEIRRDLATYMHELVDVSDKTLSTYWIFESQKEALKRRIMNIIQSSDATINGLAIGASAIFADTFNDAQRVDMAATTAELNLEGGYVATPTSLSAVNSVPLTGSSILEETYPNKATHGQILDALNDSMNTGWYATLGGDKYLCTIQLPASVTETAANGIYISPLAPMKIKITASNDGYNYWFTLLDATIQQECTMLFPACNLTHIKIEITGTTVGIRRLKLLSTGFENVSKLESVVHRTNDVNGNVVPIDCIKVEVDSDCPHDTNIDCYIQPVFAGDTSGDDSKGGWLKVDKGLVWLSNNTRVERVLAGDYTPVRESNTNGAQREFFTSIMQDDPIIDSSVLVRGGSPDTSPDGQGTSANNCGQFIVDYQEHNWQDDLDPFHMPASSDWEGFGVYNTGYLRPVTLDVSVDDSDPLQQDSEGLLYTKHTCFTEAQITPSLTSTQKDWLVIGIKGMDTANRDRPLLQPKGNYRFTTNIYVPEDRTLANKPCLLYNPLNLGGANDVVIAPFKILLNGDLVAQSSKSFAGDLDSSDLSSYSATFSFKQGWNRLEILVYYTGLLNGTPDDDHVDLSTSMASAGVGIYIGMNPYAMAREDQSVKVQAYCVEDKMVSEFALRQLVRPGDTGCWAWTDTAPERNVLLNYNPAAPIGSELLILDSFIWTNPPVMTLSYSISSTERPTGIRFKALFTRGDGAVGIPKLNSYRLIVNPTGG